MKNYTSLEKMRASEVCPTYTEEKVTAETFPAEVAKGTLYRGFQPPKDATMLKFRYYSPDGTLMEQNNVPVVYDGTGISAITTFYLLTDKSKGITLESSGWTETVQTVTAEKRFLWTYIKTTYTNKTYSCTEPCISAVFGEQGERGAMYLGHYTDNEAAWNANQPAVFTGDYYLNTTNSYIHVYNKDSNIWTAITDLTDYRYNQSINDIFEAIENSTSKEEFIKAKKIWVQNMSAAIARVQMLLANEIQLTSGKDLDGNTTGGVIRSANYDGTLTNGKITASGTKGWAIDYDGKAEFNNVTVRGTVDGSTIKGSTISGGKISIGSNFSVDSSGNTEISGTSTFKGDIYSSAMEANSQNPTPTANLFYAKGSDTRVFIKYTGFPVSSVGEKPDDVKYYASGTYGSTSFTYFKLGGSSDTNARPAVSIYLPVLYLYNSDGELLNTIGLDSALVKGYDTFQEDFSFSIYNPIARTFILKNLPTVPPTTENAIWIDSNGFLRINYQVGSIEAGTYTNENFYSKLSAYIGQNSYRVLSRSCAISDGTYTITMAAGQRIWLCTEGESPSYAKCIWFVNNENDYSGNTPQWVTGAANPSFYGSGNSGYAKVDKCKGRYNYYVDVSSYDITLTGGISFY